MYSALSENTGNIRNKINLFIACAPIIILNDTTNGALREASEHWRSIITLGHFDGIYAVRTEFQDADMVKVCRILKWVCDELEKFLSKESLYNIDTSKVYPIKRPSSSASIG